MLIAYEMTKGQCLWFSLELAATQHAVIAVLKLLCRYRFAGITFELNYSLVSHDATAAAPA